MVSNYKIISNKLGILNLPNININFYGKYSISFKNKYLRLINIYFFLQRIIYKNKNLLKSLNIMATKNNLVVTYTFKNRNTLITNTSSILINWIKTPLKLNVYTIYTHSSSSLGVSNYIKHLIEEKNLSFKKILEETKEKIYKEKGLLKIISTKKGLKRVNLIGYNIQIKGCFEPSSNQMSKIFHSKNGRTSINSLNNYIEYSNSFIYTKYGVCGIKVWLFYKIY